MNVASEANQENNRVTKTMPETTAESSGNAVSRSVEATEELAAHLGQAWGTNPYAGYALILLHGPLGAGKTAWTRGFARGLGLSGDVHSPTYTVLNVYRDGEKILHHLDLYRLGCLEEVSDIGLFEIIEAGLPCVVEWAERVPELSGLPHLQVDLEPQDDESRLISWRLRTPAEERAP